MATAVEQAGPSQQAAASPGEPLQPFVNTGLNAWHQQRKEWTKKPEGYRASRKRAYMPTVTPEQVLSFQPFSKPVPLEDVIEVLVDVWDHEEYGFGA